MRRIGTDKNGIVFLYPAENCRQDCAGNLEKVFCNSNRAPWKITAFLREVAFGSS
jgi:hypothetical protein